MALSYHPHHRLQWLPITSTTTTATTTTATAAAAATRQGPWRLLFGSHRPQPRTFVLPPDELRIPSCRLPELESENKLERQLAVMLRPTMCFTSLAGLALSGASQALAVEDGGQASTSYFLASPESVYLLFAFQAVALIGAAVGGTLARQRKAELEKMNAQLRKINEYLRSKAMMETYAPGLVYAPVGRPEDDKAIDADREVLMSHLLAGLRFLKNKNPELAFEEFKKAHAISQRIGDPLEEKKAAKGLGVSCQRQGQYREAINYHKMVLEISERTGNTRGDTEALGSIADCYCEIGDLDSAQAYYNRYIDRLALDEG